MGQMLLGVWEKPNVKPLLCDAHSWILQNHRHLEFQKTFEGPSLGCSRLERLTSMVRQQPLTISKNSAVIMFSSNQSLIAIRNMTRDGNVTYNWGYDPQNYNAPEPSFSSNPDDPGQVIRDPQDHDSGIS